MTRIRLGKQTSRADDNDERILIEAIHNAVKSKKIICPIGDQNEEVECGQRGFYETQLYLSSGIEFLHRDEIKENQMRKAMKAYVEKTGSIEISYQDGFYSNPVDEILKPSPFVVGVYGNISAKKIKEAKQQKLKYAEKIRTLKKHCSDNRITYDKQLAIEYTGELQAYLQSVYLKYVHLVYGLTLSDDDYQQILTGERMLQIWREYAGQTSDEKDLLSFFDSIELRSMPFNDIRSKLWAKLMTSDGDIKDGDLMDIRFLATVLPICDIVVCDKKMRNLIKELGLDIRNKVKVFSIADAKEIINLIDTLQ